MTKDLSKFKLYKSLGLTDFEYEQIKSRLNREPNELETYLFSALWSEHCGYKHSKKYLEKFSEIKALYSNENAGAVKVKDKYIFFKVESHNHPCAIEPFQGASTGVGGIIRDILALGAKPIALLDSLKFGDLRNDRTKFLFDGVVRGIGTYANSIGVPTISGEVLFDECYRKSPIVNVMAIGIADEDKIKTSCAKKDCVVVIVGSLTGKDGIFGASFASKELNKNSCDERFSVQIGNPFIKKLLIQASLDIIGLEETIASQDCGAAGILSSTSEMALKGECGVTLNLNNVPLREKNILPWEIMLSESQERMVFIVKKEGVKKISEIAQKYEINMAEIGFTTEEKEYKLIFDGKEIANLPVDVLSNPPIYSLEDVAKDYTKGIEKNISEIDRPVEKIVEEMLNDFNFCSKKYVYSQYDYLVGNRTCLAPSVAGSGGLWIYEDGNVAIGATIDSNPYKVFLNPLEGSKEVVLEAFRNLISSGFVPLGITNCLNFGNPEKPDVAYQFIKATDGIALASKELNIPIVSGNVSFYNELGDVKVYPSPSIGMVGYCENLFKVLKANFSKDETVFLIGKEIDEISNIGGSSYLKDKIKGEIDFVDIDLEKILAETILNLNKLDLINGCIDVSKYGILGTLFQGLFNGNSGFKGNLIFIGNKQKALFGEITGRYLISSRNPEQLKVYLEKNKIKYRMLGECIGDKIIFDGFKFDLKPLRNQYQNCIEKEINT